MKRSLTTALISTALLVAPACKGDEAKSGDAAKSADAKDGDAKEGDAKKAEGEDGAKEGEAQKEAAPAAGGAASAADALALVPDSAFVVGTMDLSMMANMPAFNAGMIAAMVQDPDAADGLQTLNECGIQLNNLRRVSFGAADEGDRGMAIIDGKGISERSKLDCLAAKAKEKEGTEVKFEDKGAYTVATADKDDMLVIAVGSDRLVISEGKWREEIEARVKGEGTGATEGSLKASMPLADNSKLIWMVMGPSDDMKRELKGQPLEAMTGAGIWIDGDWVNAKATSLDMGIKIGMPDEAGATKGKDFLATQYAQVKPMAAMFGLPASVVDKVKFGATATMVTIDLSLTEADLKALEAAATKMGGGMGGMPGTAPGGMPGGM